MSDFNKKKLVFNIKSIIILSVLILVLTNCSKINNLNVNYEDIDNVNKAFSVEKYANLKEQIDESKLVNLHKWNDSIESCDSIIFGKYEIDGNLNNGLEDIEWVLIDFDEEKKEALLISKYILDCKTYTDMIYVLKKKYTELNDIYSIDELDIWNSKVPAEEQKDYFKGVYGEQFEKGNWETSTLREWLNKEFYETAFTKDEKSIIKSKTNISKVVEGSNSINSIETKDNVFCVDVEELAQYFNYSLENDDSVSIDKLYYTKATDFAKKVKNFGDGLNYSKFVNESSNYWLRTIVRPYNACTISSTNPLHFFGYRKGKYSSYAQVESRDIGVRPAILVDLDIDSIKERFDNIKENKDYRINFNSKMFEETKNNKKENDDMSETTDDIEYYYTGGKW